MTTAQNERVEYAGPHPLCNHCKLHHIGPCIVKCHNCGKVSHRAMDCKGKSVSTGANTQPIVTCYECFDKSFKSINFSTLIDINPVRLDMSYEVELADG
ncbi:putative reverse transcriptase domain-containing protein, partial [Tanacetum coccineum]